VKLISVYARRGSPFWYAAFPDPTSGRRVCRATEFRRADPQSKRRALNWAREQAGDAGLLRNERAGWDWVEPWLLLRYRTQKKTLANSTNWWHWLESYFVEKDVPGPRALTREMALGYIAWRTSQEKRSGKKPSYNSALQELKFLGRVLREARLRDPAVVNVCERLGLRREHAPEKPPITDAEVVQIRERLDQLEGHRPLRERWMTIMFEIALHQGCREAETIAPLDRFDLKAGTVLMHVKGDRWGTVPLHPDLRPLIEALKAAGATWTCTPPVPRIYRQTWSRFFKGRDERGREGFLSHLTFHCTRVTVITRFAQEGVPIQQAMAYVMHADELIHRIYQRLQPGDLKRCLQALRYPRRSFSDGDAQPQSQGAPPATP
jgi:hypothetical protein